MKKLLILVLLLALLIPSVCALEGKSDEGRVIIDTPVDHDLFLSGNTVIINAPVDGDVFVAGGTVTINAPISGDALASGGTVIINAHIDGDITTAGGSIEIRRDVEGRIIAVGGAIDIEGNAKKVISAGGSITIHSTATIENYAYLVGGDVNNAGVVKGDLRVSASNFQNTGRAGSVKYQRIDFRKEISEAIRIPRGIGTLLSVLFFVGFLILGLVMLKLFPKQFLTVEETLVRSPIRNAAVGFIMIIVTIVVIVLLAITVVGLPFAAILGMLFLVALLISGLFVSLALGRKILSPLHFQAKNVWFFITGFVILSILFYIPILGFIIRIVVVSLGFGAIYYTLRENWSAITTKAA
ncbi:MAG: hypothetical protein QW265_04925 [Candidatus Bathyarchaeia archaeon]